MSATTRQNERRRLRRAVLKKINDVVDPCSAAAGAPAGLVDFGLVRSIRLRQSEDGHWRVGVQIMLTEPGCIMGGPFAVRIHERVKLLPDVASVDVEIDSVGSWTEASMSKRYARQLAATRAQRMIPIASHPASGDFGMNGLIVQQPLLASSLLVHGEQEVVTLHTKGDVHR